MAEWSAAAAMSVVFTAMFASSGLLERAFSRSEHMNVKSAR